MSRLGWWMLFWMLPLATLSQDRTYEQVLEDQAYADDTREDEEDLQQLQQYRRRPLNLNLADRDELSLLPFLSAHHIEQLLAYRSVLGPLHHVLELQAVPGWDPGLIRRVLPYVTVDNAKPFMETLTEQFRKARQSALLRTTSGRSPSLLLRYRLQAPLVRAGISVEKDRGERLFQGDKGISFLSAHLAVKGKGLVKGFYLGDHLVNMGQGLLLWQGRAFRKSGATVMVKRQLPVFQAYRSNDENRYMRGLAISLGKGKLGTDVFLSRNLQDANTMKDSNGVVRVTALLYSGLHRSEGELLDKNALAILSAGGSIRYTTGRFKLALNSVRHVFSLPRRKGDDPYQRYDMAGSSLSGAGLSYHYTWNNMHWFGEFSRSGAGIAVLQGVMVAADKKLDIALLGRSIGAGHRSFGSSAFTESSTVSNEDGIYLGFSWRPSGTLTVELYADHFRSRWLRYRLDRPSYGQDHFGQVTWQPNKRSRVLLRYKQETKMENVTAEVLRKVEPVSRRSIRFHIEQNVSRSVEWRARMEWVSRAGPVTGRGFAFYTDLFIHNPSSKVSGNLRLMGFNTDSYDTRIYAYDNDVMYYGLITARYGRGAIAYLNMRWQATDKLDIFIKYQSLWNGSGQSSQTRLQLIFSW